MTTRHEATLGTDKQDDISKGQYYSDEQYLTVTVSMNTHTRERNRIQLEKCSPEIRTYAVVRA